MKKPGRELDALVAEKVMGYHVVTSPHSAPSVLRLKADGVYRTKDGKPADMVGGVPDYSTDIAAAWEVVEKLQEKGFSLGLIDDDNGHWTLASTGWQEAPCGNDTADVATTFIVERHLWADTAPHAICLAALKAFE